MAPGLNIADPIASEVDNVRFGLMSSEEIRSISVKQIVSPITFDANMNPTDGGLYDPALGPYAKNIICTTCKLSNDHCPGHVGHIELPTPLYHPIFFDQMYRLLRATCVYCNKFKVAKGVISRATCKLLLLHNGLLTEAMGIDDEVKFRKNAAHEAEEGEKSESEDAETWMERRERLVAEYLARVRKSGRAPDIMISALTEERAKVVKDFFQSIGQGRKCHNCHAISPTYRKDGFVKIFEKKLSPKDQNHNVQQGLHRNHALLQRKRFLSNGDKKRKRGSETSGSEDEDVEEDKEVDVATNVDAKTGRLLLSMEVYQILCKLFNVEPDILTLIYQPKSFLPGRRAPKYQVEADLFFVNAVAVPPTIYRPPSKTGKDLTESGQNMVLRKIIESTQRIRDLSFDLRQDRNSERKDQIFNDLTREFFGLQEAVNKNIDSSKAATNIKNPTIGIKQILEKKEGLFRKNMMGKRVNFAARSVISPDPNIETNEIGVPLVFAKKLTYPEPVTPHNIDAMREAVINGPDIWPGATHIEFENGRLQRLPNTMDSRKALANQLLTPSDAGSKSYNKKVYRHLQNGDMVLMNRQPTLHKPSIMGHKARVLQKENTIRMHYANCNTYNADFDGDEMNMHLPQNAVGQAEARYIANTDNQYLVATSGKPLRGLIQDHIVMGVWLTNKETRFTRDEYQQLLYSCLRPEDGHGDGQKIRLVRPAIMKPKAYWTGKQVITTILENITPKKYDGLDLISKSQVKGNRWGPDGDEEGTVIFHHGEFVTGILDKAQFGASAYGFVHSVYEVYGSTIAGQLLSILGRLFTKFLHMRAFTCGMDDLRLTSGGDAARRKVLVGAQKVGTEVASKFVKLEDHEGPAVLERRLEDVLREDGKHQLLDGLTNARSKDLTSKTISECLPKGLIKQFPSNQMQAMTASGAKGSDVNASQISCLLGQQVLEGRRVPVMVSGKTLPSFKPYDSGLRAGGYVTDRFLTGVRPQEYYFHAMAGREGLIDTAVKTSRSGYLQRCLVKGLEGLKVHYDNTVRNSDGSLVQFLYGEDALDVTKQRHLNDFKFHLHNHSSFFEKLNIEGLDGHVDTTTAPEYVKKIKKKLKKDSATPIDPAMSVLSPNRYAGSVSEKFDEAVENYAKTNPDGLIVKSSKKGHSGLDKTAFKFLMYFKYMNSLVDPGESVGIVAAQSVGEPSTQMTLNTFHLAGHSAKNVTLGIPRLREIVMTASAKISTPNMTLTLREGIPDEAAETFMKCITKLSLSEIIENVTVRELIGPGKGYEQAKVYKIRLQFYDKKEYEQEYSTNQEDILQTIMDSFLVKLCKAVSTEHKKARDKALGVGEAVPTVGESKRARPEEASDTSKRSGGLEDGDSDDENSMDEGDDVRAKRDAEAEVYDNENDEGESEVEKEDDEEEEGESDAQRNNKKQKEKSKKNSNENESSEPESADLDSTGEASDIEMANGIEEKRKRKQDLKATRDGLTQTHKDLVRFEYDDKNGRWCEIDLEYDHSVAKILMVGIVEKVCKQSIIHHVAGITSCEKLEETEGGQSDKPKPRRVSTDGVNLRAMWDFTHVLNENQIFTNDIAAMLRVYGVEAARNTIINEMNSVFKGHGIAVDIRHLSLIADMMTRAGGFNPFNRIGMKSEVSPFLKMSFETTCNFLKDAVLGGDDDDLTSPSSRIVLGKLSKVGTGAFDVLMATA